jgi:3'-5' exonuclease
MLAELRDIIFIDIETVANQYDYQLLDERLKNHWARKASYFKRDTQLTDEDVYRDRAGIYAEFGRVVCVAVGKFVDGEFGEPILRTKAYYGDDEKALLNELKVMLEKNDPTTTRLCAHNGKEFDFPYLCRRMLLNCIPLPGVLNMSARKPWDVPHLDTMEMWKFGDYKHFTSLDLLATIFNIPSSKSDIDGSQVNAVYHIEKGLDRIVQYCLRDVVVLAQLFLKMKCITLDKELLVQNAS